LSTVYELTARITDYLDRFRVTLVFTVLFQTSVCNN
jgi:hypothetical protein